MSIRKIDDERGYSEVTRSFVERIGVVYLRHGKMVATKGWQPKRHEDPEEREQRLLAMQRRLLR